MAALVKLASAEASFQLLVFLRAFFGLCVVAPFALSQGIHYLKTARIRLHVLRAIVSTCALSCFYFAVSQIGLAESLVLNASSPLFIGMIAIFLLDENLDRRTIFALGIGFLGVVLLLKPSVGVFQVGAIVGAFSGVFIALGKVFIRKMADTEPVLRIVFYFGLFSTFICMLPLIWLWEIPSRFVVACMLAGAALGTVGQIFLTYAFSRNRAARVAPFTYVSVVFGGFLGWVIWDELPDNLTIAGTVLVMSGCLLMLSKPQQSGPWLESKSINNVP
tara:strand:- start:2001 stop:2828 length:828 start_codon:yes stop_codon:yes gene_type:complete